MTEQQAAPPDGERVVLDCHARVSWFDVRQLSATAAKTLASTIIGSMSGRRELMAALEPEGQAHFDLADRDELWIDYVADCGDGWNASHSVAWLVGRDALLLAQDGSPSPQQPSTDCRAEAQIPETPGSLRLPAGEALILGGDQVYPTASADSYKERLEGPMRSARFHQRPEREVYAIPGNHDWYDGLTSFIRLFCQSLPSRRWLGAWQTRQRRSYFAIRLPHRWWLWGVDLALEDDFDPPQQDYFLAQAAKLEPGDQLILAVPTPLWLKLEADADDNALKLGKLSLVVEAALKGGATIPLIVTGDSHFYSHHHARAGQTERDYVVCGGGGAYTLGTTQVPETIGLPKGGQAQETALFPTRAESARLRWRALNFPFLNPAFTAALFVFQWLLLQCWTPPRPAPDLTSFLCGLAAALPDAPGLVLWPLSAAALFAVFGLSGKRSDQGAALPFIVGMMHGLAHIVGALLLLRGFEWLEQGRGGMPYAAILFGALFAAWLFFGLLFGLYLALSHWLFGMHNQEVYSAQAIEHWKCFLRIRIDRDGATVYPIGLRRSERDWVPAPEVVQEAVKRGPLVTRRTLRVPPGCQRVMDPAKPLEPQLIEPPFRCGAGQGLQP